MNNTKPNQVAEVRTSQDLYPLEIVMSYLESNTVKDWKSVTDAKMLFSISMYTDSLFMIGYKPGNISDLEGQNINLINLNSSAWQTAEQEILTVLDTEDPSYILETNTISQNFPVLVVRTTELEAIETILELPELYFIEVAGADLLYKAPFPDKNGIVQTIACGCQTDNVNANDFDMILPDVKVPWNYDYHKINQTTWSISSGDNIGVVIIDSGVSEDQENLDNDEDFNSGFSVNRTETRENHLHARMEIICGAFPFFGWPQQFVCALFEQEYDFDELSADDQCGHGTRMAGIVAGPHGSDGNSAGVAYNCDLHNFRAVHNPIIISSLEKMAVTNALYNASSSVLGARIISMSIGQPEFFESAMIKMGIDFAYESGRLIVCAAGTAFQSNTLADNVFPANDPNTIAVTGIKVPNSWPNALTNQDEQCSSCFTGDVVDFAVIMQRQNINSSTTLSLNCDGDDPVYADGTSCATATFSGLAAIVWANEGLAASRQDVLSKLKSASSNINGDHPKFGYGWVDLNKALTQ